MNINEINEKISREVAHVADSAQAAQILVEQHGADAFEQAAWVARIARESALVIADLADAAKAVAAR